MPQYFPNANPGQPTSGLQLNTPERDRPHKDHPTHARPFPAKCAAHKKKASLREAGLVKIPARPTFARVSTIIGLASLTFVFGMGTRVSLQVIHRETAEQTAEPPVPAYTKDEV